MSNSKHASPIEPKSTKRCVADALTRKNTSTSESNTTGRGSTAGWTSCPLCPNKAKVFAVGRGLAAHVHAVHTPWIPRKSKKRRRLSHDARSTDESPGWDPSQDEISAWNQKVLSLVEKQEALVKEDTSPCRDERILKAGHDRNGKQCKSYQDSLPELHKAASMGNMDEIKLLLKENPEIVHSPDRNGSTATHWAAGGGRLDCLKYLLLQETKHPDCNNTKKKGRRDGKTTVHYAARNGHVEVLRYLIEDCEMDAQILTGDQSTPLHLACFGGHLTAASYLLSRPDVKDTPNAWGCTAAHWIALSRQSEGLKELCDCLRKHGIDFTTAQKQGHTPLHKAAQRGNRQVVEWLVDNLDKKEIIASSKQDEGGHTPWSLLRSSLDDDAFVDKLEQMYSSESMS